MLGIINIEALEKLLKEVDDRDCRRNSNKMVKEKMSKINIEG